MSYRKINASELETLTKQGCQAENWDTILVKSDFTPEHIHHVRFDGIVRLGRYQEQIQNAAGLSKPCGIYNSAIQDCTIGDNVYISMVRNLVHYEIGNHAVIENIGALVVTGERSFGNGIKIDILSEAGGRDLIIFDQLTAQIAYLMVIYRHEDKMIANLQKIIEDYVTTKKSSQGTIQQGAKVSNCIKIQNVNIGEFATVSEALHLEDGTIVSCQADPAIIGEGVIAKKFIILSGAHIDSGAILSDCFVGQSVQIGKQFSAENSAFFANSECFHTEACSVFAGPYTVTHHKSTLLIAGYCSFFNAGSGTNQSNHMYKLGPVHQGILERGSKTGSFSYLMWPCRVGAFTVIIGKHYTNFDTSDFPFSYINDRDGKSTLIPAINLFTVGTRRDSIKWPNRDRRKATNKLDLINFETFSPYTIGKILCGIEQLKRLFPNTTEPREMVTYKGIQIRQLMLKNAPKYDYEIAVKIYIGEETVKRLEMLSQAVSVQAIKEQLQPNRTDGCGNWLDICGLLAPQSTIEELVGSIKNGKVSTITMLSQRLKTIYENYSAFAWTWCVELIQQRFGMPFTTLTRDHIIQIINDWKESSVKLNSMILTDSEKEFDANSRIGFGLDGDEQVRDKDFEAVRGTHAGNKFVVELKKETESVQKRAEALVDFLTKIAD